MNGTKPADDVITENGLRISDRGRSNDGSPGQVTQVDGDSRRPEVDSNAPGIGKSAVGDRSGRAEPRQQERQTFFHYVLGEAALFGDLQGRRTEDPGPASQAVSGGPFPGADDFCFRLIGF